MDLRRRAEATPDAERQRKLLALAVKWEATAEDGENRSQRLDLFGERKD